MFDNLKMKAWVALTGDDGKLYKAKKLADLIDSVGRLPQELTDGQRKKRIEKIKGRVDHALYDADRMDLNQLIHTNHNPDGETILEIMLRNGMADKVPRLLDRGFDLRQFQHRGLAHQVIRAYGKESSDAARLLDRMRQEGLDFKQPDAHGIPVHHAVVEVGCTIQNYDLVSLFRRLDEWGANAHQCNAQGHSLMRVVFDQYASNLLTGKLGNEQKSDLLGYLLNKGIATYYDHAVKRRSGSRVKHNGKFRNINEEEVTLRDAQGYEEKLFFDSYAKSHLAVQNYAEKLAEEGVERVTRYLENPRSDMAILYDLKRETIIAMAATGHENLIFSPQLWCKDRRQFLVHYADMPEHIQPVMLNISAQMIAGLLAYRQTRSQLVDFSPSLGAWQDKLTQEEPTTKQAGRS